MTIVQNSSLTDIQIKFLQSLGDLIEEMNNKENTDEITKSEVSRESISKIDKTNELLDKIAQSDNPESSQGECNEDDTSIDFEVTRDALIIGKKGKSYIFDDDKIYRLLSNGWSQSKIANAINIAQPSFNKYVNSNPKFDKVKRTCSRKSNKEISTPTEEDPL